MGVNDHIIKDSGRGYYINSFVEQLFNTRLNL